MSEYSESNGALSRPLADKAFAQAPAVSGGSLDASEEIELRYICKESGCNTMHLLVVSPRDLAILLKRFQPDRVRMELSGMFLRDYSSAEHRPFERYYVPRPRPIAKPVEDDSSLKRKYTTKAMQPRMPRGSGEVELEQQGQK